MERWHIYVSGRVQGVGFRWYATSIAREFGVNGWVRNIPDGRVEIVAEGEPGNLQSFVDKMKSSYLGFNIHNIDIIKEKATGEFKEFRINFF
ncbi:MAG: acylphosphatase [Candidatus Omnitrophica bacterium]|nr:acylphosphatase [Candidatus Omnitrophota bacterium]MCM8817448.1 acylphosphatase [Candidatus Omnitrophota bacterium]